MATMAEIEELARRIVREFHPQRVVLFGSHAEGAAAGESDVDLLVIMPLEGSEIDKSVEIRLKLDPRFPVDLLVRTPEAIRRRLAMGDTFLRDILEHGKVLYAADHRRVGAEGRG